MIMNRPGAEFEYEGVIYKIGQPMIGTAESEYEGLCGSITEIRDGEDKETENDTPDLYCSFEPPILPCEIKKLEETFSDLYQQPKAIDDINLDYVIMAPSMVQPLDDMETEREHPVVYILKVDWAFDGDYDDLSEVYSDFEDARRMLTKKVMEEKENGCILRWIGNCNFIEDSTMKSYKCYLNGEYTENHYALEITEQKMCASARFMREQADRYQAARQLEDFASKVKDWDDMKRLTDEQRTQMLHDPQFPKRFQNALNKNDYYWECYWETLSEVAHEFLRMYLHEAASSECDTPKKEEPYPLYRECAQNEGTQTSAKIETKNIVLKELRITKDKISAVLKKRWIACYMLYDWNYRHADYAFDSNEFERYENAVEKLNEEVYAACELDKKLTKAYNRVLAEDVESFISQHMEVLSADRAKVELKLAKVEAEIFQC